MESANGLSVVAYTLFIGHQFRPEGGTDILLFSPWLLQWHARAIEPINQEEGKRVVQS